MAQQLGTVSLLPSSPFPLYPQPHQPLIRPSPFIPLSLQNVIVVSSQPAPTPVVITHQPHAPDYLILTIVGFALCFFFGGIVGMLFMIPALICSVMVSN